MSTKESTIKRYARVSGNEIEGQKSIGGAMEGLVEEKRLCVT